MASNYHPSPIGNPSGLARRNWWQTKLVIFIGKHAPKSPEVAEDLLQETLLSAMRARDRFAGKSSERSWLIGILKNKVVDHFRRTAR